MGAPRAIARPLRAGGRRMIRDLFHIDREHLDLRLATGALVAILVGEVLGSVLGIGLVQSGLAAFLVLASARSGDLRSRLVPHGRAHAHRWRVRVPWLPQRRYRVAGGPLLGVVAYVTGLAYGYGPAVGKAGFFCSCGRWPSRSGRPRGWTRRPARSPSCSGAPSRCSWSPRSAPFGRVDLTPEPDAAALRRRAAPSPDGRWRPRASASGASSARCWWAWRSLARLPDHGGLRFLSGSRSSCSWCSCPRPRRDLQGHPARDRDPARGGGRDGAAGADDLRAGSSSRCSSPRSSRPPSTARTT